MKKNALQIDYLNKEAEHTLYQNLIIMIIETGQHLLLRRSHIIYAAQDNLLRLHLHSLHHIHDNYVINCALQIFIARQSQ